MRKLTLLIGAWLLLAMHPSRKTKIIFLGDSVTRMSVKKEGYINCIRESLLQSGKQNLYDLTDAGIQGNKIYDFYLRPDENVLNKKPYMVIVYIGINDVWHKTSGTGTDLEKYERFYDAISQKLQAKKRKVMLCIPTFTGEKKNGANPQNEDLNSNAASVRKLAADYKCRLIDLRSALLRYENEYNKANVEKGILTTGRVLLNEKGNRLVAGEICKVIS